jgi:putative Ca2+/H+ antiporter (TMEM165/GDT1 family)
VISEISHPNRKAWGAATLLTFGIVFTAEWGDITQIAAAANAASTGNPLSVGLGAWAAEIVVAGIGVLIGERIRTKIRPGQLHAITGCVMLILALIAGFELVTNV